MNRPALRAGALAPALFVFALSLAACDNKGGQLLPIGSPCTSSSQCGSDPAYFCASHPGGYCKRDCNSDADCPPEAICAFDGSVGECHKKCDTVADCRAAEGYECKPASTDPNSKASHPYCDVADEPADGGTQGG